MSFVKSTFYIIALVLRSKTCGPGNLHTNAMHLTRATSDREPVRIIPASAGKSPDKHHPRPFSCRATWWAGSEDRFCATDFPIGDQAQLLSP